MKILAVDTTGAMASVAVRDDENNIYTRSSGREMNHLQALFPMIQETLEEAGLEKKQLDMIAAAVGPGSFTGIRIGLAAARTMAQALDLPMAGVQTLEAFAYGIRQEIRNGSGLEGPVLACPVLDARRSQVYSGAWLVDADSIKNVVESDARDVEEFFKLAVAQADDAGVTCMCICGDGWDSYGDDIKALIGGRKFLVSEENRYQSARQVIYGALEAAEEGRLENYNQVKPVYLRKSEAERKLEAGQLGKKKQLKKEKPQALEDMNIPGENEAITMRKATAEDAEAFSKLDALCFDNPWSVRSFMGELDGSKEAFYVAAHNPEGKLMGFCGAAYIAGEGEINRVAVHPLYRGRGIAGDMLDLVLKDAEKSGIGDITLEVREANRTAIALYKNHGFAVEGRRQGYYAATGENALLMRRKGKEAPENEKR